VSQAWSVGQFSQAALTPFGPDRYGSPVKVRDVLKLLTEDGWYLVATEGSHRQYKHATKKGRVTVPGKPNDDLPPEP